MRLHRRRLLQLACWLGLAALLPFRPLGIVVRNGWILREDDN
jgi:hypothetical protein